MAKKKAFVNVDICVACGECMNECPRGAIHIRKGIAAEVDQDLCVGCGLCAGSCPAGSITVMEV